MRIIQMGNPFSVGYTAKQVHNNDGIALALPYFNVIRISPQLTTGIAIPP